LHWTSWLNVFPEDLTYGRSGSKGIGRADLKIDDLVTLCRFYDLFADYIIGLVSKPTSFKHK